MDSSGMLSSTSRLTLMVALPMYSTQRLSTNRMSIGMSIVARTRAKQGRSHRRSTVRLRMLPSVVVLRQLSKVIGGTGADVGGMVSCVSWQPQALQVQVLYNTRKVTEIDDKCRKLKRNKTVINSF